jgi:hypothetical protein
MNPNNHLEIEIGGKVRSLYYGMNSLQVFMDEEKLKDVNKIQEGLTSLSGIRSLLYALCYVGDKIKGNEIDYTAFQVGFWLDEMSDEDLAVIMAKFESAHMLGKNKPQSKGKKTIKK